MPFHKELLVNDKTFLKHDEKTHTGTNTRKIKILCHLLQERWERLFLTCNSNYFRLCYLNTFDCASKTWLYIGPKTSTMLNDDFKKSAILHISLLNKIKLEARYMP